MPQYRWLIADLGSGDILDELPLSEVTWSRVLSRAGSFDAQMPLRLTHRVPSPVPYGLEVRRDTPRVHYRCGELSGTTAVDASGNSYDGTYTGTVTLGEDALLDGENDRAARLGTSTPAGHITAPAAAFAPTNSDYTIEAWVTIDSLASWVSIYRGHETTGAGKQIALAVETDGRLRLSTDLTTWASSPAGAITAGAAHHVVATFEASTTTSRLYVDAILVAESTAVGPYTGGAMTLGASFGGAWFVAWLPNLPGVIDEAALYHHALLADRIARHYQAGIGDLAYEQVDVPVARRSLIDPARRVVYVERDGQITAGYILWQASGSSRDGSLRIAGEGIWSYFARRLIRTRKTYTATDQLAIARGLVNYAQSEAGGDIGLVVGAETCGVTRSRTYPAEERKPVAEAVEQLAGVDGGFDFAVESAWTAGEIENRLVLSYPRRGRRTDLVFTLGDNIVQLTQDVDGGRAANRVDTLGDGEGDAVPIATAADANLLDAYPLLERATAWSGVKTTATLDQHARAELAALGSPPDLLTVSVRSTDLVPLGSWIEGDDVQVRARDGWIDVDGWQRIIAYAVAVGADGHETIDVTFAGAETL